MISLPPSTARPSPPPELVEAPEPIATLYERWQAGDWDAHRGLVELLWNHRNKWMIHGGSIFYLRRDDRIRVVKRAEPLPENMDR